MITREEIQIHPFALSIPRMSEEERKELRESMKSHGYLSTHPVVTFEGKILDGRHRYEMATELGIEFKVEEYQGNDPGGYVLVTNVKGRRNLTVGQRAMAAQGVLEVQEERGRQRMAEAGRSAAPGRPAKGGLNSAHLSDPLKQEDEKAVEPLAKDHFLEKLEQGRSAVITAEKAGVGADSIKKAKAVKTKAPELAQEVADGKRSLNSAYKEISQPKPKPEPKKAVESKKTEPVQPKAIEYSPTSKPRNMKQTHRELFTEFMAKLNGLLVPLPEAYSPNVLAMIAESDEEQNYWLEQLNLAKTTLAKYIIAIKKEKEK